jgi:nitrite reductase/ring-hydroxylating ferredoxin subunit
MPGDEALLGAIRFEEWLRRNSCPRQAASLRRGADAPTGIERAPLEPNEFRVSELPPGSVQLVGDWAVFNVEGGFCATQARCTHRQGALSEGTVDGSTVTCPLHGAQFNIWTGAVLHGPASVPLETHRVTVDGEIGRVEVG